MKRNKDIPLGNSQEDLSNSNPVLFLGLRLLYSIDHMAPNLFLVLSSLPTPCVCVCLVSCTQRGQKLMPIFLSWAPPCILTQSPSLNPEPTDPASLAGQWTPEICLPPSSHCWDHRPGSLPLVLGRWVLGVQTPVLMLIEQASDKLSPLSSSLWKFL